MEENNEKNPNTPRFNMNWIYISIIVVLAVLFFTNTGSETNSEGGVSKTDNYFNFKTLVMKGAAKEVVINNDENVLKMYVNPEFIQEVFNADVKQTGKNPCIEVEYGSVENLETFLDEAQKQGKFNGHITFENEKSGDVMNMFFNIFSILLFVFIMVLFFRRMGGGARPRCMRKATTSASPSATWQDKWVQRKKFRKSSTSSRIHRNTPTWEEKFQRVLSS